MSSRYANVPIGKPKFKTGEPIHVRMSTTESVVTEDDEAKKIKEAAKEKALKKLEIKREIKNEIEELKQKKIEDGADASDMENCVLFSEINGLPVEQCLTETEAQFLEKNLEFEKDVDRYIEDGFLDEIKEEINDPFLDYTDETQQEIKEIVEKDSEMDKDYEKW